MIPEQLVPALETCQELKEAGFKQETHFKHGRTKTLQFNGKIPLDFAMVDIVSERPEEVTAAAPTLQELMEELRAAGRDVEISFGKGFTAVRASIYEKDSRLIPANTTLVHHPNPVEAAALLWLKLNRRQDETSKHKNQA